MSDEIGRRNKAWAEFKDGIGCSLRDAEELAQKHGFDKCEMVMLNKNGGIIKAKWLDAYFGMFQTEDDKEHFITVDQVKKLGVELWVLSMTDGEGKSVQLRPTSENTPG